MTSSDNDKNMSNLTSRSSRTHARRSSSKLGCNVALEAVGDIVFDPASGMGCGRDPSQMPQVPFLSQANLIPRRHLEYSAPVTSL